MDGSSWIGGEWMPHQIYQISSYANVKYKELIMMTYYDYCLLNTSLGSVVGGQCLLNAGRSAQLHWQLR